MSSFRIRPSFSETFAETPQALRDRLLPSLESHPRRLEIKSFPGFITLRIPPQERHFWSPRLTLSIDPDESGGTLLHGIYGPNANVWSIFLYGYLFSGSVGLFSGIFGCCQWAVGYHPWGLWLFSLALAAAIGLYLFAQFGQKIGAQQTFEIHQAFESALGHPVEIH
jgi:hypothetical protein